MSLFAPSALLLVALIASTGASIVRLPVDSKQAASSSEDTYYTPTLGQQRSIAMLSAGDVVPTSTGGVHRLVGMPDGMGAHVLATDPRKLIVVMSHELTRNSGIARPRGQRGSFVSRFIVDRRTLRVEQGEDLVLNASDMHFNSSDGTLAVERMCSGDMPETTGTFNRATQKGTEDRMFLNGEEGFGERAFAWITTGQFDRHGFELPFLGRLRFENVVICPFEQDQTVVVSTDDNQQGLIQVYVGMKQTSGNPVQKAGLEDGKLYHVRLPGITYIQFGSGLPEGQRFELVAVNDDGDARGSTYTQLKADGVAKSATHFQRPEDAAWDPSNPDTFYVATTTLPRVYKFKFDDITKPELGGIVELTIEGRDGSQFSFDNIAADTKGHLVITSDTSSPHNAVWWHDIDSKQTTKLGIHAPEHFGDAAVNPMAPFTRSAEFTGQLDAEKLLGPGWFLMNDQAHYNYFNKDPTHAAEVVQGAQVLAFYVGETDTDVSPVVEKVFVTPSRLIKTPSVASCDECNANVGVAGSSKWCGCCALDCNGSQAACRTEGFCATQCLEYGVCPFATTDIDAVTDTVQQWESVRLTAAAWDANANDSIVSGRYTIIYESGARAVTPAAGSAETEYATTVQFAEAGTHVVQFLALNQKNEPAIGAASVTVTPANKPITSQSTTTTTTTTASTTTTTTTTLAPTTTTATTTTTTAPTTTTSTTAAPVTPMPTPAPFDCNACFGGGFGSPGSAKWCQCCGNDCGSNRAACVANDGFCSTRCVGNPLCEVTTSTSSSTTTMSTSTTSTTAAPTTASPTPAPPVTCDDCTVNFGFKGTERWCKCCALNCLNSLYNCVADDGFCTDRCLEHNVCNGLELPQITTVPPTPQPTTLPTPPPTPQPASCEQCRVSFGFPGTAKWCECCASDCNGNRDSCIANDGFCKTQCTSYPICSMITLPTTTTEPPTTTSTVPVTPAPTPAPARVVKTLQCDSWVPIDPATAWTAFGKVIVAESEDGLISVELDGVSASNPNMPRQFFNFMGHVHDQPCEINASGGHYKVDPNGPADVTNELWAGGRGFIRSKSAPIPGKIVSEMASFTLHQVMENGELPKRVCCNLAPPKVVDTLWCDAWVPIAGNNDYTATGSVYVTATDRETVAVELVDVQPKLSSSGQVRAGNWIGHVHEEACEVNASGEHWKSNRFGPSDTTNELWAGGEISFSSTTLNDKSIPIDGRLGGSSFTLHETLEDGSSPKRVCCNLKPREIERVLTCDNWVGIEGSGVGWTGSGAVRVTQGTDGTVDVTIEDVTPMKNGAVMRGAFIGHVHNQRCEIGAGGGHWQVDASGPVDTTNELWAGGFITSTSVSLNDHATPIRGVLDDDVQSFVLHQREIDGSPKRLCCNLEAPKVVQTLTGSNWQAIADDWSGTGVVRVNQYEGNLVDVEIESVQGMFNGQVVASNFIGYVQNQPCAIDDSRGPWEVNSDGDTLRVSGVVEDESDLLNLRSAPLPGVLTAEARSFTLREFTPLQQLVKRICVDLAPVKATTTLVCDEWVALPSGAGWAGSGLVTVTETDARTVGVELLNVQPTINGQPATGNFMGHVHAQRCEDNESGGHWKIDSDGIGAPPNELWAGGMLDGEFSTALSDRSAMVPGQLTDDVMSFTLHENLGSSSPKRICCNLVRKLACNTWTGIEGSGDNWEATGVVEVSQTNTGDSTVSVTNLLPKKDGVSALGQFIGHVHNEICEVNASGGHWQVDEDGPVDTTNELWAGPRVLTAAMPSLTATSQPVAGRLDENVKSFTLHETLDGSSPKRVCCNLEAPQTVVADLKCNSWTSLSGDNWQASGLVTVSQTADGRVAVEISKVMPWRDGVPAVGDFIGHVHNKECEDEQSGGHWQVDPNGPADTSNELWAGGRLSTTVQTLNARSTPIVGTLDFSVKSFTLHERTADGSPKRVCCNLSNELPEPVNTPLPTPGGATTTRPSTTSSNNNNNNNTPAPPAGRTPSPTPSSQAPITLDPPVQLDETTARTLEVMNDEAGSLSIPVSGNSNTAAGTLNVPAEAFRFEGAPRSDHTVRGAKVDQTYLDTVPYIGEYSEVVDTRFTKGGTRGLTFSDQVQVCLKAKKELPGARTGPDDPVICLGKLAEDGKTWICTTRAIETESTADGNYYCSEVAELGTFAVFDERAAQGLDQTAMPTSTPMDIESDVAQPGGLSEGEVVALAVIGSLLFCCLLVVFLYCVLVRIPRNNDMRRALRKQQADEAEMERAVSGESFAKDEDDQISPELADLVGDGDPFARREVADDQVRTERERERKALNQKKRSKKGRRAKKNSGKTLGSAAGRQGGRHRRRTRREKPRGRRRVPGIEVRLAALRDEMDVLKDAGLYQEGKISEPPSPRLLDLYDVPETVKAIRAKHASTKRRYNRIRDAKKRKEEEEPSESYEYESYTPSASYTYSLGSYSE